MCFQQPAFGTGFHRYYILVYKYYDTLVYTETPGLNNPSFIPTGNWNFVEFFANPVNLQFLTASASFITQNAQSRIDSNTLASSEWTCSGQMDIIFAANVNQTEPVAASCDGEVPLSQAQTLPVIRFPDALSSAFYTLILMDRDSPSAQSPLVSPLRLLVLTNIRGADLASDAGLIPGLATVLESFIQPNVRYF